MSTENNTQTVAQLQELPDLIVPPHSERIKKILVGDNEELKKKWRGYLTTAVESQRALQEVWEKDIRPLSEPKVIQDATADMNAIRSAIEGLVKSSDRKLLAKLNVEIGATNVASGGSSDECRVATLPIQRVHLQDFDDFPDIMERGLLENYLRSWQMAKMIQLYWNYRLQADKEFTLKERKFLVVQMERINNELRAKSGELGVIFIPEPDSTDELFFDGGDVTVSEYDPNDDHKPKEEKREEAPMEIREKIRTAQMAYGGSKGVVSSYFEGLRLSKEPLKQTLIMANNKLREIDGTHGPIQPGLLDTWWTMHQIPQQVIEHATTPDADLLETVDLASHKNKVDAWRNEYGFPENFTDSIWGSLIEAAQSRAKVGRYKPWDDGMEMDDGDENTATSTPPQNSNTTTSSPPQNTAGNRFQNSNNGSYRPSNINSRSGVEFSSPPFDSISIKSEDTDDDDNDGEPQGLVLKPKQGRENGEHQVWRGGVGGIVIEKFGPTKSCIYRTTKMGDLTRRLEPRITPELKAQQIGEEKQNGVWKYTRRHLQEVVAVAFEEDDDHDPFWDLRAKKDREAKFKKEGKEITRSKPAYVKLKWLINGSFTQTWEPRSVLRRLVGDRKTTEYILHVAERTLIRYENWELQGARRTTSRSPTRDAYFDGERANQYATPPPESGNRSRTNGSFSQTPSLPEISPQMQQAMMTMMQQMLASMMNGGMGGMGMGGMGMGGMGMGGMGGMQ